MADRESYERTLTRFKDGDLDGARQGFAEFLLQHPHSDLAPNARFWLGESYYGKKDFSRAIDAYDQVQLNHPASEKVPAALFEEGLCLSRAQRSKESRLGAQAGHRPVSKISGSQ
jgi:tol-pal system protein YbgF